MLFRQPETAADGRTTVVAGRRDEVHLKGLGIGRRLSERFIIGGGHRIAD
jgi:hypothetical protein